MPGHLLTLSPKAILAAWRQHPARHLDTYGSDPRTRARAFDPAVEAHQIQRACNWLREQWGEIGRTPAANAYLWALEPEVYELGTEALWQVRALQQLSSWWNLQAAEGMPLTDGSGVVVRQTLVTGYDQMSPRYMPRDGIHFVVLPQAYFDFSMLIWQSFVHWCGSRRPEDGWGAVTSVPQRPDPDQPDPWLLEAIARQVAQPARDVDIDQEDAASAIAQHVPFFVSAVGVPFVDEANVLLRDASYLLADFAIAHEMGHRLAGHSKSSGNEAYLEREVEADGWGAILFRASWGWRAEVLAGAPFDDALQLDLGQLVFVQTTRLRGLLAQAVRSQASPAGPRGLAPFWGDVERERARRLEARAALGRRTLVDLGGDVSQDAVRRLDALTRNLNDFTDYVLRICASIPEADLDKAIEIARSLGSDRPAPP